MRPPSHTRVTWLELRPLLAPLALSSGCDWLSSPVAPNDNAILDILANPTRISLDGSTTLTLMLAAHRLKGSAGAAAARRTQKLAARLEDSADPRDLSDAGTLLSYLESEVPSFRSHTLSSAGATETGASEPTAT